MHVHPPGGSTELVVTNNMSFVGSHKAPQGPYDTYVCIPTCEHMVHIQKRDNSACVRIVYAHCVQPLADPASHLTMS